jgi:hypothetical protein
MCRQSHTAKIRFPEDAFLVFRIKRSIFPKMRGEEQSLLRACSATPARLPITGGVGAVQERQEKAQSKRLSFLDREEYQVVVEKIRFDTISHLRHPFLPHRTFAPDADASHLQWSARRRLA